MGPCGSWHRLWPLFSGQSHLSWCECSLDAYPKTRMCVFHVGSDPKKHCKRSGDVRQETKRHQWKRNHGAGYHWEHLSSACWSSGRQGRRGLHVITIYHLLSHQWWRAVSKGLHHPAPSACPVLGFVTFPSQKKALRQRVADKWPLACPGERRRDMARALMFP